MEDEGLFIKEAIDKASYGLEIDKQDRAFIKRLVYGVVEHRLHLDYVINQFSKTKTDKMKLTILTIIRISVYQLMFLETIHQGAVINEAVKMVKKRKIQALAGFVNGVLRQITREIDTMNYPNEETQLLEALSIRYSMPQPLLAYLLKEFTVEEVKAYLNHASAVAPLCVRVNTLETTPEALALRLEAEGVQVTKSQHHQHALRLSGVDQLMRLSSFQEGLMQVQDESSMYVGVFAEIQTGNKVLDMCAAPGGKTMDAAMRTTASGQVTACDIGQRKLDRINENAMRLGLDHVKIIAQDGTKHVADFENVFDVVLADVPCSGLGIIRKKPDIKWHMTPEKIESLVRLQRAILINAASYVKLGGTLIYSTCTLTQAENQDNMKWFLSEFSDFEMIPIGIKEDEDKPLGFLLKPWVTDTDGFFVAKLRKKG